MYSRFWGSSILVCVCCIYCLYFYITFCYLLPLVDSLSLLSTCFPHFSLWLSVLRQITQQTWIPLNTFPIAPIYTPPYDRKEYSYCCAHPFCLNPTVWSFFITLTHKQENITHDSLGACTCFSRDGYMHTVHTVLICLNTVCTVLGPLFIHNIKWYNHYYSNFVVHLPNLYFSTFITFKT